MVLDSMSDSCLFQLEKYYNSNPYTMKRSYIPLSAHSNRFTRPMEQLINHRQTPFTLDRFAYKLRMKSALHVDTLRELHGREHHHNNSPTNDLIPRATTTFRQRTAVTRTTNSTKIGIREELQGIEGNAVHVGTLDDLIQHFHQEEIRLNHHHHHHPDYPDNSSIHTSNNRSTIDRPLPFASEPIVKKPHALTEYHFKVPNSPLNISRKAKPLLPQRSLTKRHEKPVVSVCNKLTIIEPFNSKDHHHPNYPSNGYLFPPIRAFGYFTRKSADETPVLIRRKPELRRMPQNSLDSLLPIRDEKSLINKSITTSSLTDPEDDDDDDLENPPNTRINVIMK